MQQENVTKQVFYYHYNGIHSAIHNLGVVHACNCVPVGIVGGGVVAGGVVGGGVVGGGVVVGGVVGGGVVGGGVVAVRGRTRKREME